MSKIGLNTKKHYYAKEPRHWGMWVSKSDTEIANPRPEGWKLGQDGYGLSAALLFEDAYGGEKDKAGLEQKMMKNLGDCFKDGTADPWCQP